MMGKFFVWLKDRPLGRISLAVIILLYLMMIFAEFVAPYPPTAAFPSRTYHPPNFRFNRGFKAQEARLVNTVSWKYTRIKDHYENVRFFAKGDPYKLWGIIPMERHLFTTGPRAEEDAGGPYPVFLMGADGLGRDLFSRIVYGSRISLTIGFIATAISLALAVLFGGIAGYSGGAADWGIMRFSEFFMLIPGLYLILFLRSLLSTGMDSGQTYMMITIILSLVGWPGSARTVRGMVHAIKREEFVQNARLEMIPAPAIVLSYIIPQIASLLIVSVALSVPGFIMTETTLSYLGLGIADPAVSWGSLIKRDITTLANLRQYPWLLQPVWFLLAVTLAFNFLGDCLRDFFDPYHTVFSGGIRAVFRRGRPGSNDLFRRRPAGREEAPEASGDTLLEVRGLRVSFSVRGDAPREAVRDLSFTVRRGEILGIVGESGSGKTAATQAVPGLLPANAAASGSILYEGKELLGADGETLRAYRGKKIGMIFQEPGRSYDPLQSVEKAFLETLRNREPDITVEAAREKTHRLLAEVGLDQGERLSNFPHQFSGGQLQRIGIALALAQGCELLVADEPSTALDVTIQKQIVELLRSLQKSRAGGLSVIFISHDIELVAGISSRIIVMYGGIVMESGPARELAASPRHPYTRALLAASPAPGSHYTDGPLKVIPAAKSKNGGMIGSGCPFAPRCPFALPSCFAELPPLAGAGKDRELRCNVEAVE
jgi:peptide/nickel transport system permease protein